MFIASSALDKNVSMLVVYLGVEMFIYGLERLYNKNIIRSLILGPILLQYTAKSHAPFQSELQIELFQTTEWMMYQPSCIEKEDLLQWKGKWWYSQEEIQWRTFAIMILLQPYVVLNCNKQDPHAFTSTKANHHSCSACLLFNSIVVAYHVSLMGGIFTINNQITTLGTYFWTIHVFLGLMTVYDVDFYDTVCEFVANVNVEKTEKLHEKQRRGASPIWSKFPVFDNDQITRIAYKLHRHDDILKLLLSVREFQFSYHISQLIADYEQNFF
jgi:hypothetical protein